MLEIEVKARIRDRDLLLSGLASSGCELSAAKTQDDTVYVRQTGDLAIFLKNDVFVRIRIQDGKRVILTAKKPVRTSPDMLVKHEHETVVSSVEEVRGILELMGFAPAVRTKKTRRTGHAKDYEVCLDDIEGLGSFIELEKMGTADEAEHIQTQMWEFLRSLGVEEEDRVTKGYDILMLEEVLE